MRTVRTNFYLISGLLMSLLLILSGAAFAVDVSTNATVEFKWALHTNEWNNQAVQLSVKPELLVDFAGGGRVTAIGRVLAESITGLQPNDVGRESYSAISKPALLSDSVELELRELYFETTIADDYVVLGKQQLVWGKADGLKVLDVVNPQTFREFILDDFEDSRIPLWMVNYEWQITNHSSLQFLWVPDQSMHALPNSNATYAFTTPRLVPVAPPGVAVEVGAVNRPSRILADSDVGLRWSAFIEGWDLTLNYLYRYDDLPVFFQHVDMTGTKVLIEPEYKRTHLLGGAFSNAFGDLTVRGEIAYNFNRYFLTSNPNVNKGVVKSDELSYVLGLDWFGLDEALLSFQFFQSYVTDSPSGLTRPVLDNTITFLAQKEFFNDTLKAEVLVLRNLKDEDGQIRSKLTYELNDDVTIWTGVDVFHGNEKGLFGQYDHNDRVVFGIDVGI